MAKMYRAGTAFVEVVPSFKGMQKDIARHFRESLRKELSNKDTFKGLEKNLEQAFQNGIKGAAKETRNQIRLAVQEVEKATEKTGKVANKNLREATKNIGGAFELDIRKAGANLRKVMGQEFGKGLDADLHGVRDDVRKGMDSLANAFHEGGLQNVKEIRKTRNRLEKNLKAMLDMPGMTELARANAEEALKALNSAEYLRRLQGMSDQELKLYQDNERRWVNALVTARNEREAQAKRDEAAAKRAAEAKERQAEKDRIAEERRAEREKKQAEKLAKEEREAEEKRRKADIAAAEELAEIEREAQEKRLAAAEKFGKSQRDRAKAQQDELDRIEAEAEKRRADVRKKTDAAWKEYENRIIGGDFEAQVRKGGKKVRDALSEEFGKELSGELAELRDDVRRDMDLLAGAYRHGGLMNEREINEVRQRLVAALSKLSKDSRAGGLTRFNAESGLKALDSNEYLRTLDSMNEAELRAYREHQNKLLKAQVEANRSLTAEERRYNEERHQNRLAEERRQLAADARENARRIHNRDRASRREVITGFDREGTKQSRTDRLAERSEASIRAAQARVTSFLRDLERLDRARPRLVVETHDAVSDIRQAQQVIRQVRAESEEPADLTIRTDVTEVRREVQRLKGDAERILSNVNMEVDIEDEEFRKAMAEYRAQLELLDQMEVDPELILNPEKFRVDLREVRANLMRLEGTVTSVEVVADTDEAARDVHVLQAALAALKDKTVGVDISEREALAEIATIEAALERLERENPKIEVDVVYDRSAFNRFHEGIERSRISIGRLNRAVENSRISMSDTTQAFRIFSPVMTAVTLAGPPLISALGGIAGGLGAIVSVLPGAIGGLSALAFGFGGVGSALGAYEKSLKGAGAAAGGAAPQVDALGDAMKRSAIATKYGMMDAQRSYRNSLEDIKDSSAEAAAQIKRTFEDALTTAREARARADAETASRFKDQRDDANASYDAARKAIQEKIDLLDAELRAKEKEVNDRFAQKRADRTARLEGDLGMISSDTDEKVSALRSTYSSRIDAARSADERARLQKELEAKILAAQKEGAAKEKKARADHADALKKIEADRVEAIEAAQKAEQKKRETQLRALAKLESDHAAKLKKIDRERVQALQKNAEAEARAIQKAQKARSDAEREADADAARATARAKRQLADAKERLKEQAARAQEEARLQKAVGAGGSAAAAGIDEWTEAMEKLGPEGVEFVKFLHSAKEDINDLQKLVRKGLLPGVQSGLESLLDTYKGPLGEFLESMGHQLGDIAERWGELLTTDAAGEWFSRVAEDAEIYTSAVAMAIENIVGGFASLTDAFRPFAREFMDWLVNSTQRFEDWAGSLSGNAKFEEFLDAIRTTLPLLGDFSKKVGELFVNLVIAVEPFTVAILDAVNAGLDFINAMDPGVLAGILGAVGGLTAGLMILSGVMAGLGAISAVISALGSTFLTKIAAGLAGFLVVNASAIGAMKMSESAAGYMEDATDSLAGALGGMADFGRQAWDVILGMYEAIEPLIPTVVDLASALVDVGTSIGSGFLVVIEGIVDAIGWMIDLFTELPVAAQEVVILFGAATTAGVLYRDEIKKLWDVISGVIGLISDFGNAGIDFVKGFIVKDDITQKIGGLAGGIENVGYQADVAKTKAQNFKGAFIGWGAVAIGLVAVTAAVAALAVAAEKLDVEATTSGVDAITASFEGLRVAADGGTKALDDMFTVQHGGFSYWALGAENVDGMSDAMATLEEYAQGASGKMAELDAEISKLGLSDTKLDEVEKQFEDIDESLTGLVQSGNFEAAALSFDRMAESAEENGVSMETLMGYTSSYQEELEKTADRLGVTKLEEEDYYNWMRGEVPRSIQDAVDAQDRQQEGLAGVADKTEEAEQATRELIDAQDELSGRFKSQEEANVRYYEVLDQFNEHMATATQTLDVQTEAGRENREWFKKMAEAAREKADADLAATGDTEAYTEALWSQRETLVDMLEPFFDSRDAAGEYANTLLEIDRDISSEVELKNYAETRRRADNVLDDLEDIDGYDAHPSAMLDDKVSDGVDDIEDKLDDVTKDPWYVTIGTKIKQGASSFWDRLKPGGVGNAINHDGNILEFMAKGGLRPMSPIAQMVKPDTWRVVGDRMDVDEAYIPLDGSKRSKDILLETMLRMPGMFMHDGGIVAFAEGAVASPGAATPGAEGATDVTMAPVSEAFAALEAALRESYAALMAEILGMSQTFFADLLAAIVAFQAAEASASGAWRKATIDAMAAHLAALSTQGSTFRAAEISAMSAFHSTLKSNTDSAHNSIESAWSSHYGDLNGRSSNFRSGQLSAFDGFYSSMRGRMAQFGATADTEWSGIWRGLVNSADSIFGELPDKVGSRLAEINRKMNANIVDPFNKIVSDMSLDKDLKISPFPTQAKATGGHVALRTGGFMPGYTPGRDVHTFVSPTGGVLELSGGEPVLRPEAGVVLGRDWVDGVNAAARNGGISGVKSFLGYQGHKDGGVMSFADGGTIPRTRKGIVQLGRMLQAMGVRVSEHPDFGGVDPVHSPNSWHYRAGALDLNTAPGTSAKEMADFDRIMPLLYKLGWGVIWRYPNHYNHAHVDLGNRSLGSFNRNPDLTGSAWEMLKSMRVAGGGAGGGGMDFFDLQGEMKKWLGDSKKAVGKIAPGRLGGMATGLADKIFSGVAEEKASDFFESAAYGDMPSGSLPKGSGVERWRGTVVEALKLVGQSTSRTMQDIVLRRMNQESSGNPRAINNWDVNARRGTPSKGLMQVIDPTFRAHARAPYNRNIWDPMSNITASMYYALSRYGSLPAAYNRKGGYKDGGIIDHLAGVGSEPLLAGVDLNPGVLFRDGGGNLPAGFSLVHNNLEHEETILPHTTAEVTRRFEEIVEHLDGGSAREIDMSTHFHGDLRGNPREIMEEAERMGRVRAIQRPMKF